MISGDASGSMEIAIQTSSIIAGLLTAVCSAKLVFFNTDIFFPDSLPTNIEEVKLQSFLSHLQSEGGLLSSQFFRRPSIILSVDLYTKQFMLCLHFLNEIHVNKKNKMTRNY